MTNVIKKSTEQHPFGGCNNVFKDYLTIGRELLTFETSKKGAEIAFRNFREGVVFVSLAVLESYLEDLLDSDVSEERLAIETNHTAPQPTRTSLVFIAALTTIGFTLSILLKLLPIVVGLCFVLFSSLCLYYMCFLSPKNKLLRRMHFAKIVSREIARRRGIDEDGRRPAKQIIEEWFSKASQATALPGAAKIIH